MKRTLAMLLLSLVAPALHAATGHDYFASVKSPDCRDLGRVHSAAYTELLSSLRAQARSYCHGPATCSPDYDRFACQDSKLSGVAFCSCLF